MMDIILNPLNNQIQNFPLTQKEVDHKSRKRLGYHVYASYFFHCFATISTEEKQELMYRYEIWSKVPKEEEDDESISSGDELEKKGTCTSSDGIVLAEGKGNLKSRCKNVIQEEDDDNTIGSKSTKSENPTSQHISRLAGLVWRGYSSEIKNEWGNRALTLNSRPRNDGKFTELPDWATRSSIEECIKDTLTQEWVNLVNMFKNAFVVRRNDIQMNSKVYKVGREKVQVGNQVFRKFTLSPLLCKTIFSSPLFCNLKSHEIVYRTKREVVIHLHSNQRVSELFNFGGLKCGIFHKKGASRVYVCAKVSLIDENGRCTVGYVMEENDNQLGVSIEGNNGELVWVCSVAFDSVTSKYQYLDEHSPFGEKYDIFHISYFWPIRIKLNMVTGHSYLIASRYTCNLE